MIRFCAVIDAFSDWLGRVVAWLTLLLVLVVFLVVLLRYVFGIGSVALQESALYLHAPIFLLGATYTLRHDRHVRVDVVYRLLGKKGRALLDLLGTLLLLLPLCGFLVWSSWDYVAMAWTIREGSREAGGLPLVFVLKTLLPVAALLLAVQGLAEAGKRLLVLLGRA